MRVILDLGKALACLIFCGLLVLLVPSSAWSVGGEEPSSSTSPSPSPAPESASPSEAPTSSESASPSPSGSSGTSSEEPSPEVSPVPEPSPGGTAPVDPTTPPEPAETVYVVTEAPAPEQNAALAEGETVVSLSDDDRALVGLAACLLALGVGARIVGSFA